MVLYHYFASKSGCRLRSIMMSRPMFVCMSVCLSVCVCLSVREDISGNTHAIFTKLFVHVAYVRGLVPSGMFTISCIACRRERGFFPVENELSARKGGWECTARAKYAICDGLVSWMRFVCLHWFVSSKLYVFQMLTYVLKVNIKCSPL